MTTDIKMEEHFQKILRREWGYIQTFRKDKGHLPAQTYVHLYSQLHFIIEEAWKEARQDEARKIIGRIRRGGFLELADRIAKEEGVK